MSASEREDGMRRALAKITRCEGRFSRDPLTHASNTIEAMARIAQDALDGRYPDVEEAPDAP